MNGADGTRTTSPWGRRIRAFLALVTLAEIIVLLVLAQLIGVPATLLILLAFSAAGVAVLRYAARRLFPPPAPGSGPAGTASVRVPPDGRQMAESVPLMGAGILMTVPGILTGVLGTLLLFAPIRRALRPLAIRAATPVVTWMQQAYANRPVVPGEIVDEPPRPAQHVDVEIIELSAPDPPPEEDDSQNRP